MKIRFFKKTYNLENKIKWSKREDKNQRHLDFYIENYNRVTRWLLKLIDSGLYNQLRQGGLLENVPLAGR